MLAWVGLVRAHATGMRRLDAAMREKHGLTLNDYEVLLLLSMADESMQRRTDLARRVQLTPSGITRLVGGLERDGLVTSRHCESDARVTWAVLTEDGAERLDAARHTHHEGIGELLADRYTDAELEQLAELLGRLDACPGSPAQDVHTACREDLEA
jgi:DNA-binding MarR family transcriptional regulator